MPDGDRAFFIQFAQPEIPALDRPHRHRSAERSGDHAGREPKRRFRIVCSKGNSMEVGTRLAFAEDAKTSLDEALEQWTLVLGRENIILERRAREEAETATFASTQTIPAILRPASRVELQECVHIANRFRIPIYPVSSGKNWGYG